METASISDLVVPWLGLWPSFEGLWRLFRNVYDPLCMVFVVFQTRNQKRKRRFEVNSIALTFILSIDEMICETLTSQSTLSMLSRCDPARMNTESFNECGVGITLSTGDRILRVVCI